MNEIPVKQHHKMKARHPQLLDAVDALGMAVAKAGPLNDKVRHLVQLAASAAIRSEGAVHSHARRAVEAGASVEEVRQGGYGRAHDGVCRADARHSHHQDHLRGCFSDR